MVLKFHFQGMSKEHGLAPVPRPQGGKNYAGAGRRPILPPWEGLRT
jgi:hypothetical protein